MLYKISQITDAADYVISNIQPGDVVALSGPLAAGKTTLTKAIVEKLGFAGRVTSPTFVLEHHYPVNYKSINEVIHLDFYRLNEDQIESFGWKDRLGQKETLTIIEWPERAEKHLPKNIKDFTLEIINEETRRLEIR